MVVTNAEKLKELETLFKQYFEEDTFDVAASQEDQQSSVTDQQEQFKDGANCGEILINSSLVTSSASTVTSTSFESIADSSSCEFPASVTSTPSVSGKNKKTVSSSASTSSVKSETPSSRAQLNSNGNDEQLLRCEWDRCSFTCEVLNSFYDHVTEKHVQSQLGKVSMSSSPSKHKSRRKVTRFRCKWKQCRMYDSEIPSFERLEKHVRVSHTKEKAFRCRLQDCSFQSNHLNELLKHMDVHDKVEKQQSKASNSHHDNKHSSGNGESQILSKQFSTSSNCSFISNHQSRKTAYARVCKTPARYPPTKRPKTEKDEINRTNSLLELEYMKTNSPRFALGLKNVMTKITSFVDFDPNRSTDSINVNGKVIGRRTFVKMGTNLEQIEKTEVLVRWFPLEICPDEWKTEDPELNLIKQVPISNVPKKFWTETASWLMRNNKKERLAKSKRKSVPSKLNGVTVATL